MNKINTKTTFLALLFLPLATISQAGTVSPTTGFDPGMPWIELIAKLDTQNGGLQRLYHATVSLSAAQINGMYAAPVQLIAAPGAGHSIAIAKAMFAITRTSTAFASGGASIIQYDSTVNGGGTQACDSTIAATVVTGAAGLSNTIRNGAVISDSAATDNKGIYISNATGAFTTGTGTAVVDVFYYVN